MTPGYLKVYIPYLTGFLDPNMTPGYVRCIFLTLAGFFGRV